MAEQSVGYLRKNEEVFVSVRDLLGIITAYAEQADSMEAYGDGRALRQLRDRIRDHAALAENQL